MIDLLRLYCVKDGQSEPHQQNQNYAERKIQQVKGMVNGMMDPQAPLQSTGCSVPCSPFAY